MIFKIVSVTPLNYGYTDNRQTNLATIGAGTITITKPETSAEGLNRDVTISQYNTYSGGLKGGVTVDTATVALIKDREKTLYNTVDALESGLTEAEKTAKKVDQEIETTIEKTENLLKFDHYTEDKNVSSFQTMDEYEKKVENGKPVSASETLAYYGSKNLVGEALSPDEQMDMLNAYKTVKQELSNSLSKDILDTYTKDTAVVINAKIALLKEIDPDAAHAIEVKFAKERAANEKTKEAKYLADFKELDRSKTNEYLEGQKGKDLSYYAGEFGEGLLSSLPTKDEIKESLTTGGLYLINPALGSAYEFNKRVETVTGLADNISEQGAGNYLGNVAENVKEKVTEHPAEVAGFIAGELIENALINKGLSVSGITSAENVLGVTGKADDVAKAVPNPYGKAGGPLHQEKISEVVTDFEKNGYTVKTEYKVETPGGFKESRWGDALVKNEETGEKFIIQVGKETKGGLPVSREAKAIQDFENAGYGVKFYPYNK